jgi:NitT/TauT family transport system permease protein/sulfonate transport system permease protein
MISATKLRNLLGLGAALGIWQLTVSAGWVNEFMMPSPMDVVKAIGALAADGSLREHLSESLLRVGMGYLIAAAIGLPIGFLCGMWKSASEVIRPVIEALRPIPPLAWVPIAILWFGLGDASAYFLVFLGCFFPMFFGAYTAVRSMDQNLINAARCLGASRWMLLRDVFVPASLPIVMPNLRLALGWGWMCVVTAELIAAQSGLGYLIQQSRQVFQIQNVVAGMATIGLVGYVMSASLERLERNVNAWAPAER